MSAGHVHPENCGCCRGVTASTPVELGNRPGLSVIAYRVGTHHTFKRSMLARLSSSGSPALLELRTRKDDDFTIALLDAWAAVADVLTFYQERLANEAFLRTATERLSIRELARLIGYHLSPGVAASAYLAFIMEEAEGAPEKISLASGIRVQSTPGPDEKPQTFETVEDIEARPAWNAIKAQLTRQQPVAAGQIRLYLDGVNTRLEAGDAILIVGDDRVQDTDSLRWRFRILTDVEQHSDPIDPDQSFTIVAWDEPLSNGDLPVTDVRVYALRRRAALFGHNAPNPLMLNPSKNTDIQSLLEDGSSSWGMEWIGFGSGSPKWTKWKNFKIKGNNIDLDAVYKRIVTGSWIVLEGATARRLYRADQVKSVTREDYALSAKVSRIEPDHTTDLSDFKLRHTTVYAESGELPMADLPVKEPVYGDVLALDALVDGLQPGQRLAVSGKRQRLQIRRTAAGLTLHAKTGTKTVPLAPGDELRVAAPPVRIVGGEAQILEPDELIAALADDLPIAIRWELMDRDGFVGTLNAASNLVRLRPAQEDDQDVTDIAAIKAEEGAVSHGRDRTTLTLAGSLEHVFDRETVRLNANVALATHGETVAEEVLGSGDATKAHQQFPLRQAPLTHVSASNAKGREPALKIRVNDISWKEVHSLYGRGPNERIYKLKLDEGGATSVQFGDGVHGARLPTGQNNVRAIYRKGIGLQGMVGAEQLDQLMSRPLGLKEALNPLPADGAGAAEVLADARRNAPLTVLTLDRVVSLQDFEDFARAYAGIAKAHAAWVWQGDEQVVVVTVAGPRGAVIQTDGNLFKNLSKALRDSGDPYVAFRLLPYRQATFRLSGSVFHHLDHLPEKVLDGVKEVLVRAFSFEARDFGQPTALSEVVSVIHEVPGVVAVDLDELYRSDEPAARQERLLAEPPGLDSAGTFQAAELLTIDPASLVDLELSP